MTRPLVAVAGLRSSSVKGLRYSGVVGAAAVLEAVFRAGGEPVVVAAGHREDAARRLDRFDALVLPGGADLDPASYGAASRHDAVYGVDAEQDAADLALAAAALRLRLPTLGLCRGMQVLNVAAGGTLHQHLPASDVGHWDCRHDVVLAAGSVTRQVMGAGRVSVSAFHHQAVDRVGAGFVVTGTAADGCVEVIEHLRAPVLAVQWHPEDDAADVVAQQALFDTVVARHHPSP